MPEIMRTASAEHFDTLWSWNTLKRRPQHYTLDFHTKSPSVGEITERLAASSNHPKEYPCFKKASDLACSKKRGKKRERDKKRRKKERERKEKERKEEGKSEGEPWLHTL